ncbi:uncharacterized protein Dwil_GK18263, isoform A [Drosophila willistoni]|uniref:Uncharacterized protein, isoform A n=1 Tax=Drosophila willistoni TaxID=7260 RepID=B4MZ97_DROWI|nr:protein spire isoform X2 [Drosophila willistoni]EDW77370.1 uncharacterized protein Dwil_GK18263, isoform A [Drosophila willistoni]
MTEFSDTTTDTTTEIATKSLEMAKVKDREMEEEHAFLSTSPDSANGDGLKNDNNNVCKKTNSKDNNRGDANTTNTTNTTITMLDLINQAFYQCNCGNQCVTLDNILDSFKAPLSEDQAWALIYQFSSLYHKIAVQAQNCLGDYDSALPYRFVLHFHRDGSVHFSIKDEKKKEKETTQEQEKSQEEEQQQQQMNSSASSSGNSSLVTAFENNNHHHHHHHHHTPLLLSHRKIIGELVTIVYTALDYNLPEDEECQLSQELNSLFNYMTIDENDEDCIDEGIDEGDKRWDDDAEEERNHTKELDYIIETCRKHIEPALPENHYKAVCRALVTETIELRIFLQQVLNNGAAKLIKASESSQTTQQELAKLGFNDWARFWVQVIDELRRGVRLKKSNYERTPIEYELTPYEILMGDIRAKKYQLRKVMVNGDIPPRVKKDAHAMILEFIRSRPPLKKASERQLGPPLLKCIPSPREQLLESIRQGTELKQITPPKPPTLRERLLPNANSTLSRSRQRLIKVDFSKLQDDEHIFDESSLSSSNSIHPHHHHHHHHLSEYHRCSQPKMPPYPIGGYIIGSQARPDCEAMRPRRTMEQPMKQHEQQPQVHPQAEQSLIQDDINKFYDNALESYDLATQSESKRSSLRRHTIVGCQSNFDEMATGTTTTTTSSGTSIMTHSMPPTRPESRQSDGLKELSNDNHHSSSQQAMVDQQQTLAGSAASTENADAAGSTSSLGPWNKSFMDKQTWMERGDDRLSVTLEEIVHIRSVMTKAELEGLPMDVRVKEDVEKRRVCFLCLRTRFSFFGPWGIQCKLCQRTVCAKCYTKMRIPSEHFRNVPLVLISPSLLSSPASSNTPSPSHHQALHANSTGNIMDDQFPKSLIERLLRSESERKTRSTVGSAPSSPKHQRSNMSTPGITMGPGASASTAPGQAVEALHDQAAMSASYSAAMRRTSGVQQHQSQPHQHHHHQQQQQHYNNVNTMSRSMEGPRSLPVHSPAHRPLSNSSTLERKSRFPRGFGLFSSSGSHLATHQSQDTKENLRGDLVTVCNDCQGLVNEITSSVKQKRSSARNRTIQNLTLDLTPVWK